MLVFCCRDSYIIITVGLVSIFYDWVCPFCHNIIIIMRTLIIINVLLP